MEVPGIDIVGPLPADLQSPDSVYISRSPAASGAAACTVRRGSKWDQRFESALLQRRVSCEPDF
jgi:hypothetical protein